LIRRPDTPSPLLAPQRELLILQASRDERSLPQQDTPLHNSGKLAQAHLERRPSRILGLTPLPCVPLGFHLSDRSRTSSWFSPFETGFPQIKIRLVDCDHNSAACPAIHSQHHVQRFSSYKAQNQTTWKRLIFRIILNGFPSLNNLPDIVGRYASLKHSLDSMEAKLQRFKFHGVIIPVLTPGQETFAERPATIVVAGHFTSVNNTWRGRRDDF